VELAFSQSESPQHLQFHVVRPTGFSAYLLDWKP
jgi:hypothetical protein